MKIKTIAGIELLIVVVFLLVYTILYFPQRINYCEDQTQRPPINAKVESIKGQPDPNRCVIGNLQQPKFLGIEIYK